jgi:ribosomal-protein-alanine N-acetyltransferase
MKIETGRLLLFPLTLDQLALSLHDSPRLAEQLGIQFAPDLFPAPVTQAIEIKIIRMIEADHSLHPWFTYWMIELKEEGVGIGMLGFKGAPSPLGIVEIGYGISDNYRNMGYTTEAVRALIEWAFQHPECHAVVAETLKDNLPSIRVLEKIGMQLTGEHDGIFAWRVDREDFLVE